MEPITLVEALSRIDLGNRNCGSKRARLKTCPQRATLLQTSHYPSDFQATGTTETIGTTGTALPILNDLDGAQRLNGLNDLNLSPFDDVIDTFSHRRYSLRKRLSVFQISDSELGVDKRGFVGAVATVFS